MQSNKAAEKRKRPQDGKDKKSKVQTPTTDAKPKNDELTNKNDTNKKLKTNEEDLPRGNASFTPMRPRKDEDMQLTTTKNPSTNLFNFEPEKKTKKIKNSKEAKEVAAMDQELSNIINIFKLKDMNVGTKTLGVISGYEGVQLMVDLPNYLKGFVDITEISEELNLKIDDDLGKLGTTSVDLKDYFKIGQPVRCVVSDLSDKNQEGKVRISLTMRPTAFNTEVEFENIVPGLLVRGSIKSIQDHGYIVNLGIEGVQGFLKKEKKSTKYVVGMPVDLHVISVNEATKIVTLSNDPSDFHKVFDKANEVTVHTLNPGQLVNAEIYDTTKCGLFLKFLGMLGTVYITDMDKKPPLDVKAAYGKTSFVNARILWADPQTNNIALTLKEDWFTENKESGESLIGNAYPEIMVAYADGRGLMARLPGSIEGFIPLKHAVSSSVTQHEIDSEFPVGKVLPARVISWNYFYIMPVLTVKPTEITHPYFSFTDVSAGDIIDGTVSSVGDDLVKVKLSDWISGVCYSQHWSDSKSKKVDKKFKEGKQLKFKVLKVDVRGKRILLSAKPSIVNSTMTTPSDYTNINTGDIILGWVVKVGDFGIIVGFYEDISAVALRKTDLGLEAEADHTKFFAIGQTVTCKVVNVDIRNQRMRVTFNLDADVVALAKQQNRRQNESKRQNQSDQKKGNKQYKKQKNAANTVANTVQ